MDDFFKNLYKFTKDVIYIILILWYEISHFQ